MKNRFLLSFILVTLTAGAFVINGCKDTATDPTYVALAEIRFADYHQIEPIQIFMYPPNASSTDSLTKTPTAMTYGLVTPYLNNLPTNRTAGMKYHLVAVLAGTTTIVAFEDVVLMPGDKKTWLITATVAGGGSYDTTLINDLPPANQPANLAYYRFLNVTPDHTPLNLVVGDPLNTPMASGVIYRHVSDYVGLPVAKDTSVTFYVVDPNTGTVLSRLSGVGLSAGTYHTITWGGQAPGFRIPDPTSGNLTLNDTTRIRILDDDQGVDFTVTAPLTFRFNIINALLPPPNYPGRALVDYTQPNSLSPNGGLAIVINNNTVYDYQGLLPFSFAPSSFRQEPADSGFVFDVVPTTTPLVDKIFIVMVKPTYKNPSTSDSILFRFYAGNGKPFITDELYTIVVFDTAKAVLPKNPNYIAPYDSAAGTITVPIPDIPVSGSARIVLGYMLATPVKPLAPTSNNGAVFTVNGIIAKKVTSPKSFDSSIVVPAGHVDLEAQVGKPLDTDKKFGFTAEAGGIYEAFLVGQRGRKDSGYGPGFIVVRVNPH